MEYTLPAAGTIEGTVTDKNDGKPIEGAIVTLKGPAGERVITTDAKGRWKAQALVGENTVQVDAPNYVTASHPVTIARKDQAEAVDTALTTGVATVTVGDLDWLLDKAQKATADVTVTNSGSAPLEVRISEQKRTSDGGHEAADLAVADPHAADEDERLAVRRREREHRGLALGDELTRDHPPAELRFPRIPGAHRKRVFAERDHDPVVALLGARAPRGPEGRFDRPVHRDAAFERIDLPDELAHRRRDRPVGERERVGDTHGAGDGTERRLEHVGPRPVGALGLERLRRLEPEAPASLGIE